MIWQAKHSDIPALLEMGVQFHAYSPWSALPYDRDAVRGVLETAIDQGGVWMSESGMCGGVIHPLYFSPTKRIAAELFWWSPTGGRELRQAFETWAKDHGASHIQCSALHDEHLPAVTRLYERAGYRPAEVSFVKEL